MEILTTVLIPGVLLQLLATVDGHQAIECYSLNSALQTIFLPNSLINQSIFLQLHNKNAVADCLQSLNKSRYITSTALPLSTESFHHKRQSGWLSPICVLQIHADCSNFLKQNLLDLIPALASPLTQFLEAANLIIDTSQGELLETSPLLSKNSQSWFQLCLSLSHVVINGRN